MFKPNVYSWLKINVFIYILMHFSKVIVALANCHLSFIQLISRSSRNIDFDMVKCLSSDITRQWKYMQQIWTTVLMCFFTGEDNFQCSLYLFLPPPPHWQVNGTEADYEYEEITLERVKTQQQHASCISALYEKLQNSATVL